MALLTRPPEHVRAWKDKRTRWAHDIDVTESIHRQDIQLVNLYHQGGVFEVTGQPTPSPNFDPERICKRGTIKRYTARSRARLMYLLAKLRRDCPLPLFITLTYPNEWPGDWETWKAHLHVFCVWLSDRWPTMAAIWKLEPQERGAPHYHLLVFGVPFIPFVDVAKEWAGIVGSNDYAKHLASGTRVERVESFNGVCYYAAKYIGKECAVELENCGRFWGIVGRKNLPLSEVETVAISARAAIWLRRIIRRKMRGELRARYGRRKREHLARLACGERSIKPRMPRLPRGRHIPVYTTNFAPWIRAGEWSADAAAGFRPNSLWAISPGHD